MERENPEYAADGELDELLSSSGWQLEEYVDIGRSGISNCKNKIDMV